jgi:Uma2 family endonuclease
MSTVQTLMTAEEFRALPDVERLELVRGVPIEVTRPKPIHGRICTNISYLFERWSEEGGGGLAFSNDTGLITERDPDTVRGPDAMFYREGRLALIPSFEEWFEVPPDLAVEVRSPTNRWSEVLAKVAEYLEAGVAEVWVVDPEACTVEIFRADEPSHRLAEGETLTGGDVLPGFTAPVARIFRGI